MRDPVPCPLGGDQRGQAHRRIASLTQRAAERSSTSRSIASSAFSLRSRLSSSRSLSLNGPSPTRLPDDPNRALPELLFKISPFHRHHFLKGDVSTVRRRSPHTIR